MSFLLLAFAAIAFAAPVTNFTAGSGVSAAETTTYMNAIGLGVTSKAKTSSFYLSIFGMKKLTSMSVPDVGPGAFSEDINTWPGPHSSALVVMEWAAKQRNVKDLPIKLTIAIENPKEKQALIEKSGGKALDMQTEANPDAIYAKDLDGYLLELVQGSGPAQLKAVGLGVSDISASAAWWSTVTGFKKGAEKKAKEWDYIPLSADKGSELHLMRFNETPKRNTSKNPIKVVLATSNTGSLTNAIHAQKGTAAGGMGIFQEEPLERTLVEINRG